MPLLCSASTSHFTPPPLPMPLPCSLAAALHPAAAAGSLKIPNKLVFGGCPPLGNDRDAFGSKMANGSSPL
ncbi:hypothetical protein COCNU_04G000440 [Cocos nucifera]|uniref:Uncharacterized protein n=1 Tax=Cocos nucifera TaxID=13894 RepID=A0A8K0I5E2_COCNU|nr:hypothetical protein COCNU_04G000440 [Cocos nucifera]